MFAALPKLADKAFIVGFLAPVLVAVFGVLIGFRELPGVQAAAGFVADSANLAKLTVVAAGVWFGSLAVLLLNRPIYRALEGYVGPLSAPVLRARAERAWARRNTALAELRATAVKAGGQDEGAAATAYKRALRRFRRELPPRKSLVLPTRFGNVNRAFESYAAQVYDAEAILLWPRLSAILPKDFQSVLGDARAQVNCFVNLTALAVLLAAARLGLLLFEAAQLAAAALATPAPAAGYRVCPVPVAWGQVWAQLAFIAACLIAARLAYGMACERAMALGDQVKVAFDLYLPSLPGKLGYVYPDAPQDRQAFWATLEEAYDFHKPPEGLKPLPVDAEPPGERQPDTPLAAAADEPEDPDEDELAGSG